MDEVKPPTLWEIGGEGILTDRDLEELGKGTQRVYRNLLCDGRWHSVDEIELAAGEHGVPAREGLRRARELRKYGELEKKRLEGKRQWLYRFVHQKRPSPS